MSREPNVISRPALSARAYAGRAGATGVCGGHLGEDQAVLFGVSNAKKQGGTGPAQRAMPETIMRLEDRGDWAVYLHK
jgi:hypothetical protein